MATTYEWIQRDELNLAYSSAQNALNENPNNKIFLKDMFRVLSLLLKRETNRRHLDSVVKVVDKITQLDYQPEKHELEYFFWYCRTAFALLKNENAQKMAASIILFLDNITCSLASDAYSAMLTAAVINPDINILRFIKSWNLNNLRAKDYKPQETKTGTYPPVVAILIKPLKNALEQDKEEKNTELRLKLLSIISSVLEDSKNYPYAPYYYIQLNSGSDAPDTIMAIYRKFLQEHCNDFWAWKAAGDLYGENPEMSLACYCKALTCKSKPEFLIGVRDKIIPLLLEKQLYEEARCELDIIITIRKQHEWSIENHHLEYLTSNWYQAINSRDSNRELYHKYAPMAMKLLGEIVKLTALVTDVQEKYLFWAAEGGIGGRQKKTAIKNATVFAGDTITIELQGKPERGVQPMVIALKKSTIPITDRWVHHFSGEVVEEGDGYKAGNVFINRRIGERFGLTKGIQVNGLRAKVYHRKLGKEVWHIVQITFSG